MMPNGPQCGPGPVSIAPWPGANRACDEWHIVGAVLWNVSLPG